MSVINFTYHSGTIFKNMEVSMVLPVESRLPGAKGWDGKTPFKTVYLLHGLTGDNRDWLYCSDIVNFANQYGIAVVMPNSWNRYYLDNPRSGEMHGDYIAKEIVDLTRKMFPLSDKREDTAIAGFSMGGYGAFHLGLKYPDTFSGIISLAGGFRYKHMDGLHEKGFFAESVAFFQEVYGELDQIPEGDADLEAAVQRLKKQNKEFPAIYLACGTEDRLLEDEHTFRDYLRENGINIHYEEGPGSHNWKFVNSYLGRGLEWWLLNSNRNLDEDGKRIKQL